ncbi:uncharacterized protein STEHIDRAFT_111815 [Stereum hirsutum FP-91666 SS1]|uniref:uncharacterized protein n=1 Tax=Stereum hirsutum (strain FP-91666) TaxID=721885 RepID=UPI0004449579|nr:uncharacterized protein STEHIDRAFT_111815 [Stereum hirsutum FP-91666 SS1]EIM86337.1 hypothetical protein STEHIDRAFT_111815 [Stereum hirsutum FP-91666 SS1]
MKPTLSQAILSQIGNPSFNGPDFFLHAPRSLSYGSNKNTPEATLAADPLRSLPSVLQMITYSGDRTDIEASITGMLAATPGMILRRLPNLDPGFDSEITALDASQQQLVPGFALFLNRMARSRSRPWFQTDILHPALIIGIDGKGHGNVNRHQNPLHDLALTVRSHLNAHLENWRRPWPKPASVNLGDEQYESLDDEQYEYLDDEHQDFPVDDCNHYISFSPSPLEQKSCPPWMIMFGIVYDSGRDGHLTIVAHIPHAPAGEDLIDLDNNTTHYVSCVIDRISIPGIMNATDIQATIPSTFESPYLANLRAVMCLLTLKRHAVVMANAWEKTMWPDKIVENIDLIEDKHLPPLRTASESGEDGIDVVVVRSKGDSGEGSAYGEGSTLYPLEKDDPPEHISAAHREEIEKSVRKVESWMRRMQGEVEI